MSKIVPLLLAGAGASGISATGIWLVNRGEGGVAGEVTPSPTVKDVKFDTLEKFKKEKGGECSTDTFGDGIDFGTSTTPGTQIDNGQPPQSDTYFGDAPTGTSTTTKSCLIIDWKKTNYEENSKWKGTFTWTWSFVNDQKGFILFGIANTKDNKKLEVTGGFYLLEKETKDGTQKYTVKYHKEIITTSTPPSTTEIDDIDESKFPKAKVSEDVFKSSGEYWGFTDTTNKLTNVCGSGECTTGKTTQDHKKWIWNWSGSQDNGKEVGGWCEKLDWFDHVYGTTSFQLKDKLVSFKGVWTNTSSNS